MCARESRSLRDRLLDALQSTTEGMTVNGKMDGRLPGNLSVSFDGIDGEELLMAMDDIAVSSGAACTQAEPSHVLMALGHSRDRALASLRFGIGRGTTADEIGRAASKLQEVVVHLRSRDVRRAAAGWPPSAATV